MELHRELNALNKTTVPGLYAVSTCAPQEALRTLDAAFAHFSRRCQRKRAGNLRGKVGYPNVKTKKRGLGSFGLTGRIVVFPNAIHLPRLGRLRLKEHGYLPPTGTIGTTGPSGTAGVHVRSSARPLVRSATLSEQAGHWPVSL